jgi:hypothetical protein
MASIALKTHPGAPGAVTRSMIAATGGQSVHRVSGDCVDNSRPPLQMLRGRRRRGMAVELEDSPSMDNRFVFECNFTDCLFSTHEFDDIVDHFIRHWDLIYDGIEDIDGSVGSDDSVVVLD